MPRISEFYGIVIYMYYRDHSPPHFHAIYAEQEAVFEILTTDTTSGELPNRAVRLIKEWASANRDALLDNWELARTGKNLIPITPLS